MLNILLISCSTSYTIKSTYRNLTVVEKSVADSLVAVALDHEALYTLADTLKPMSSIKMYRLPLLSNNQLQTDSAYQALTILQKTVNNLNGGDWCFILNPFERPDSIYKNIELYVVRKSRMASVITQQQTFYSRLGISPNHQPGNSY
ncbi:MAG: hypothetical protein HC867_07675 [Bacteroidia bacterium]|nr:hypothetical protein [Bacteroidia bacterium]